MNAKLIIRMKLVLLLVFASLFQANAASYDQSLTISKENVSIVDVFKEIKKQTDYNVICDGQIIKTTPAVSINVVNASLEEVMEEVLAENDLTFVIQKNTIIVNRKAPSSNVGTSKLIQELTVTGKVTDKDNLPLIGVSVTEKGTKNVTVTDINGNFNLTVAGDASVLTF